MDANIQPNDWMNENKPRLTHSGQFGILMALVGGGLILAFLIQLIMALSMVSMGDIFSGDSKRLLAAMAKPENINKARLMQMLGTLVLMCFPALVFAKIVSKQPIEYLGLKGKFSWQQVGLVVGIAIAALFLSGGLGELNKQIPIPANWAAKFKKMEDEYAEQVMVLSSMKTFTDYLLSMVMIAILPAIFEELLFRGALQRLFVDWFKEPHIAIFVTAFLFSIIHFSYYGLLPRLALGLILGYIYFYSKNIWLNMLMHFINNGVAITAMYLSTGKNADLKNSLDETMPLWVGAIALLAVGALLNLFKKQSEIVAAN